MAAKKSWADVRTEALAPVRSQIRLPRDVHCRLQTEAKKNRRSFNAEMVVRLEASLGINPEIDLPVIPSKATSRRGL